MTKNGIHRDKDAKNDPVLRVMSFLFTSEAQDIFSREIPYMLPSQIQTLGDPSIKINPESDFNLTIENWYNPDEEFAVYDM